MVLLAVRAGKAKVLLARTRLFKLVEARRWARRAAEVRLVDMMYWSTSGVGEQRRVKVEAREGLWRKPKPRLAEAREVPCAERGL